MEKTLVDNMHMNLNILLQIVLLIQRQEFQEVFLGLSVGIHTAKVLYSMMGYNGDSVLVAEILQDICKLN